MHQAALKMPTVVRALECESVGLRIAVPLRFVDQLIEYDCAALPLAKKPVNGLGVYEGSLLVSLSLAPRLSRTPTRIRGVFLRDIASGTPFALEVDRTRSFVELAYDAQAPRTDEPWLAQGTDSDGSQIFLVDVEKIISQLDPVQVD